jgi:hypothetical protein
LESNGNSGTRKHKIEILEIENMVTEIKGFFFWLGSSIVLTQRRKESVNLKIVQ